MTRKFKTLFVFVVLGMSAAAGCQGPGNSAQPQVFNELTPCLRPTCEEVSVIRGDVTVGVSPVGSLRYGSGADLSFGSVGRVASVSVREGSLVESGQVLAALEPSSLQLAVLESRIALIRAEGSLQEVLKPRSSAELLRVEAEVTVARDLVESAEEALKRAQAGSTELELAQAEAAVSTAAVSVQESGEALELLRSGPTKIAMAKAQALVATGKSALLTAEKGLTRLRNDVASVKVTHQENQLVLARVNLKDRQVRLAELKPGPDPVAIKENELKLETARLGYLIAQLNLVRLRARTGGFQRIEERLLQTRIILADLRLDRAEEEFKLTKAGPTEAELAMAETLVTAAVISVQEAEQILDQLKTDADGNELAEAEALVDLKELALLGSEELLADLKRGVDPVRLKDQENRWVLAQINLEDAQGSLAKLQPGPDPAVVLEKHRELNSATNALLEARRDFARLKDGRNELEVELSQAQVQVARVALDVAEQRLTDAIIVAPFEGLVRAVTVAIGQQVGEETVVIQLVDTNALEMVALMNKIDVRQVTVGQEADITIKGLRDTTFQGRVISISPIYSEDLGDVSYEVVISGEALQSTGLLPGMTALAEIVLQKRTDVLLIPVAALSLESQEPTVDGVDGGNVYPVSVTTGLSNGRLVEVTQGLQEGDVIRVRRSSISTPAAR